MLVAGRDIHKDEMMMELERFCDKKGIRPPKIVFAENDTFDAFSFGGVLYVSQTGDIERIFAKVTEAINID
jgi:hypothetical protein